jgi:hypothetical protein
MRLWNPCTVRKGTKPFLVWPEAGVSDPKFIQLSGLDLGTETPASAGFALYRRLSSETDGIHICILSLSEIFLVARTILLNFPISYPIFTWPGWKSLIFQWKWIRHDSKLAVLTR